MKVSAASSAAAGERPAGPPSWSPPTVDPIRLVGPSRALDRRVHAARRDIADVALAAQVFAPHYARPLPHSCVVPVAPLRADPLPSATQVSELLLGEGFAVVDVTGGWAWGYALADHYVGYLALSALGAPTIATHRVRCPAALLFAAPDIKAPVLVRLPMGAQVTGEPDGDFLRTVEGWVHRRHLGPVSEVEADWPAAAERLIGTPYRWGGRSGDGIDCSGLVQLALAFGGRAAPRDSDQQQEIGTAIPADAPLRRGDLVFWPGHVGIMADATHMVHANAHWMAVVREPLADVAARNPDPVLARRRP